MLNSSTLKNEIKRIAILYLPIGSQRCVAFQWPVELHITSRFVSAFPLPDFIMYPELHFIVASDSKPVEFVWYKITPLDIELMFPQSGNRESSKPLF